MKKTLIALALTALPVAAMADVTLYGQIKGGLNYEQTRIKENGSTVKNQLSGEGKSGDAVVRDFGSRIGFKGEEDLGNGLKTIWQVEQSVSLGGNTASGDNPTGWSNRESFIGLEGNFGKVRVGHLKNVFDENSSIDPWEYDSASPLGLGVFTRHEERVGGASIKYNTPEFAGFTGSLQYRTKANGTAVEKTYETETGAERGQSEFYAGVNYENSGFFAKYGYGQISKSYAKNGKPKAGQLHRLEGGYDANNLFVSAAYQYGKGVETSAQYFGQSALLGKDSDHNPIWKDANGALVGTTGDDFGVKTSELALTAAYTMGAITPRVSYAHGWDVKAASGDVKLSNTKYDQIVLGADYALSKRTTALVSAGWLRQGLGEAKVGNETYKNKLTKSAVGVGMKHVF